MTVYFIQETPHEGENLIGSIKIGFTKNIRRFIDKRLPELQTGNSRRLIIKSVISEASLEDEQLIHKQLRASKIRPNSEWYYAHDCVLQVVDLGDKPEVVLGEYFGITFRDCTKH